MNAVDLESIPEQMRQAKRWVLWRYERRGEKMTKIPYRSNNSKASSTDSSSWSSFYDVVRAYEMGGFAGLGFVLGDDGERNWMGIDLDKVYGENGWVNEEAQKLAESMGSYMELSPSRTGVHIIGYGRKGMNRCRAPIGSGELEVYDSGRYFTVTGYRIGEEKDVQDLESDSLALLEKALNPPKKPQSVQGFLAQKVPGADEIVEMIRRSAQGAKFDALYAGNTSGYPSRSEAEYALIGIVNWWTRDESLTHAIVSNSGIIDPAKWKRLGETEIHKSMSESNFTDSPPWAQADLSNIIPAPKKKQRYTDTKNMKLRLNIPRDHFICRYTAHWSGVNDAYPDYHYATALALLSAGANRVLRIRIKNIGDIKTNLWFMLLGKSSFSRKSTSIKPGVRFAKECSALRALPGTFSPESLLEVLDDHDKVYHFKDEAAQILAGLNQKAYMADLRDLFCQLYDGSPFSRVLRSKAGVQTSFSADEPYLTLEWATTPENFLKTTTAIDTTSGFLLRFLPVYPQYPKETKGFELGDAEFDWMEVELMNEYKSLVDFVNSYPSIAMKPSAQCMERYNDWMKSQETEKGDDGISLSVLARYVPMVLKLAALLAMGDAEFKQTVVLDAHSHARANIPDWCMDEALRAVSEYFAPMQVAIMSSVGTQHEANVQEKILCYIRDNGGCVTATELGKRMRMKSKELREHIEALCEAEEITIEERETAGRPVKHIRLC